MRFTRTIVTVSGLALAGITVLNGVGEGHADADPARPASILGAATGETGGVVRATDPR